MKHKRILSIVLAVMMLVAMLPTVTLAEDVHTHDGVTFTAWTDSTKLPTTAGSYYLTTDVTLSATWQPVSGETTSA